LFNERSSGVSPKNNKTKSIYGLSFMSRVKFPDSFPAMLYKGAGPALSGKRTPRAIDEKLDNRV
jgi:hypothetical protein